MRHLYRACFLLLLVILLPQFSWAEQPMPTKTDLGLQISPSDSFSFVHHPYRFGVRLQSTYSHRYQFDDDFTQHFFTGVYNSALFTLKTEYHEVYAGPQLLVIPNWEPNADSRHARMLFAGVHLGYRYYMGYFVFPTEIFFQMDVRYTKVKYNGYSLVSGDFNYFRDILEGAFGIGFDRKIVNNLRGSAGASLGFRTRGEGMVVSCFLGLGYTFSKD